MSFTFPKMLNLFFKLKTRNSLRKRYHKKKNAKVVKKSAFRCHLLQKKSTKRKRRLKKSSKVFKGERKQLLLYI